MFFWWLLFAGRRRQSRPWWKIERDGTLTVHRYERNGRFNQTHQTYHFKAGTPLSAVPSRLRPTLRNARNRGWGRDLEWHQKQEGIRKLTTAFAIVGGAAFAVLVLVLGINARHDARHMFPASSPDVTSCQLIGQAQQPPWIVGQRAAQFLTTYSMNISQAVSPSNSTKLYNEAMNVSGDASILAGTNPVADQGVTHAQYHAAVAQLTATCAQITR